MVVCLETRGLLLDVDVGDGLLITMSPRPDVMCPVISY